MGHTPDGVFNLIGDTIEILSAPDRTIEELALLRTILREAREKGHSAEQVAERVKREVPGFANIISLLLKYRHDIGGCLGVMIAGASLVVQLQSNNNPTNLTNVTNITNVSNVTNVSVEQVVEQAVRDGKRPEPPKLTEPKQGRNAPCPCGSGKKYKHCCGAIQH